MIEDREPKKEKDTIYTIEAGSKFYLFRTDNEGNAAEAVETFKAMLVGKSNWGGGWLELVPLTEVKISNAFYNSIGQRDVITWHPNNH
jgi:hypothetical protein